MKKAKRILALFLSFICLFIFTTPAFASDAGYTVIDKVLVQLSNPPVVMMDPGTIRATTGTEGCSLVSMSWLDVYSQPITTVFPSALTTLVLNIVGYGGYLFAENVSAYINNEPVSCAVGSGGASLTLTKEYMPSVWAPTVNKNPGADKVDEGGTVSFVATADYADKSTWKVLDKNGQLWTMEQLALTFPNFNYHDSFGKLIMNNVPRELDGAQFCCTFDGPGGKVDSNWATLKVKYEVVETPAPTPSPTPTSAPSSTPASTPAPTPEAVTHIHDFSGEWKYDDGIHWHECDCGEQKDFAPHDFTWETVEEATRKAPGKEKGACSVCGYEKEEALTYNGFTLKDFIPDNFTLSEGAVKRIVIAAVALLILLVAGLLIARKIKRKRELERRRKEALRRRRQKQQRERQE